MMSSVSPLSSARTTLLLFLTCLVLFTSRGALCQIVHHRSRAYQQQEELEVNKLLREGSPSTLWYSSSAAAASSVTGVGASRIPAQYHHMFHYDGPQPHHSHQQHDSPYGSYTDDTDPTHAVFGLAEQPHSDESSEEGQEGAEDAEEGAHHPPSSYMHEGFLHHVPEWMKKETEEERNMAHRGGNTAEDRLLAHKRKQERLEREREMQKDAL